MDEFEEGLNAVSLSDLRVKLALLEINNLDELIQITDIEIDDLREMFKKPVEKRKRKV